MIRKKIVFIVIVIVLILMLIPYRKDMLWDGGSVEYKSVLCKYTRVQRLADVGGYYEGTKIELLGLKVFDNTKLSNERKSNDYYEHISLNIKNNILTDKGATFILKNNTNEEYSYGDVYVIEKYENNSWKELNILTGAPLSWNDMLYNLKPNEEREISINWSLGYGELKNGTYRLVKNDFRKKNNPDSRLYSVYVEFEIPIKVMAGTSNTIQVEKNNLQNSNKFSKYLERDGKKIYIASNIKEIYYDDVKTKQVLKDYVQNTYQTIDDSIKHLTNYLSLFSELNDGGTKIYKSQEYDITIVKCNTVIGNKDYFIGDYNMNFDSNSMCSGKI